LPPFYKGRRLMGDLDKKRVTFLHISDFHFKTDHETAFDQNIVLKSLIQEIKKICDDKEWRPELVLCTGDMAFSGNFKEYLKAIDFLNELAKTTLLSPQRFFIIPGNHDIDLSTTIDAHKKLGECIDKLSFSEIDKILSEPDINKMLYISNKIFSTEDAYKAIKEKFTNYLEFLRLFGHRTYKDSFYFSDIYLSESGLAIGVVGLNSAFMSEGKGASEYGHMLLGIRPLLKVFEQLENQASEKNRALDLTVALCHHPFEWLYEAERTVVNQIVPKKTNILLEGHQNNPQHYFYSISPSEKTLILQEGPAYDGSHWPNRIQFTRYTKSESKKEVEIRSVVFDPRNIKWVEDTSTFTSNGSKEGYGYFSLWERPVPQIPEIHISHWNEFYAACNKFEHGRSYILIIGGITTSAEIKFLGRVDWELVIDFDPATQTKGTYSKVSEELSQVRSLHLLTLDDSVSFHPEIGTYWFGVRGLEDRPTTLVDDSWRSWNRRYSQLLRTTLERFGASLGRRPVTVVLMWHNMEYIRTVCEATDTIFGNTVNFVFATTYTRQISNLSETFSGSLIPISMPDICRGFEAMLHPRISSPQRFEFPSFSEGKVCMSFDKVLWLQEEMELIHLGVGVSPTDGSLPGRDFYRGRIISWFELMMHFDVQRDQISNIKQAVERDLKERSTRRINLYHWPGAGGTTVARRVGWDIHETYPTVILNQFTGEETVSRLRALYDLTQLPLFVILEAANISDTDLESLYGDILARPFPVVFLNVRRVFERKIRESERVFFLDSTLTINEATRFFEAYSHEVPEKKILLNTIAKSATPSLRNPFYFGLVAFEKEFISLEEYVQQRIKQATSLQLKLLLFISLVYHYTQKSLSLQLFHQLLGILSNSVVLFNNVFSEPLAELLISENENVCRPIHELVAVEIMQTILAGEVTDKRVWVQNLSLWSKDFAFLCSNTDRLLSDEIRELLKRLFIYREQLEISGTDVSLRQRYAELIEDIPSAEGRLEVLKYLTELFPEESHFWAHYGRFLMMEMGDIQSALISIKKAIDINDKDFIFYHIKGMIIGRMAINKMESFIKEDIGSKEQLKEIQNLVKEAGEQFKMSTFLSSSEREHGYVSHIKLLLRTVDFGFRISGFKLREEFLSSPNSGWYRDLLDISAILLQEVESAREGESSSLFVSACESQLFEQYGDFTQALKNWTSLLSQKGVYQPPIRRHIMYTYLAKAGRTWYNLSKTEIDEILDLMEANLREEPGNEINIRNWFNAARRSDRYSIDAAIERLSYWHINSKSTEALFYLYILYAIQAIENSAMAINKARDLIYECSLEAKNKKLRIRTTSIEWLGKLEGLKRLINYRQLDNWEEEFKSGSILELVSGRIAKINSPTTGDIELTCGLRAFFVPSKGLDKIYYKGNDENKQVQMYIAFSYDGLRAWSVRDSKLYQ